MVAGVVPVAFSFAPQVRWGWCEYARSWLTQLERTLWICAETRGMFPKVQRQWWIHWDQPSLHQEGSRGGLVVWRQRLASGDLQ